MPATVRAHITPEVLRWARKAAKVSVEDAAQRANQKNQETYEKWESGELRPTVNQAKDLAKYFGISYTTLYRREPPKEELRLPDFRSKDNQKEYSRALVFLLRQFRAKQAWAHDALQELEEDKAKLVGSFSMNDDPEDVGTAVRSQLNIGDIIHESKDSNEALQQCVHVVERQGIFVGRIGAIHSNLPLDPNEFKGIALVDDYAPYIIINSKDWKNSQLFTLFHELAHLLVSQPGISDLAGIDPLKTSTPSDDEVETFCNRVAAAILMPAGEFKAEVEKGRQPDRNTLQHLSRKYRVSELAALIRLRNLKRVDSSNFTSLREAIGREFRQHLKDEANKPKGKSGGNPTNTSLARNGRAFSMLAYASYMNERIGAPEFTSLTGLKVSNLDKVKDKLFRA